MAARGSGESLLLRLRRFGGTVPRSDSRITHGTQVTCKCAHLHRCGLLQLCTVPTFVCRGRRHPWMQSICNQYAINMQSICRDKRHPWLTHSEPQRAAESGTDRQRPARSSSSVSVFLRLSLSFPISPCRPLSLSLCFSVSLSLLVSFTHYSPLLEEKLGVSSSMGRVAT